MFFPLNCPHLLHFSYLTCPAYGLEAGAFIYGIINYALAVFSSIEHVVKENAQVMSELEKLKGGKYEYKKSKLSTDQSIQRLEEVKAEFHAQEE